MGIHQTKTFMSGNSVAVRLPKELNLPAGTSVQVERQGDEIIIRPEASESPEDARRDLQQLVDELRAIGRAGVVQERDVIEFPVRSTRD